MELEPKPAGPTGEPLTVYFDGSCPLCSREVDVYRARTSSLQIRWVDAARSGSMPPDLPRGQALERFHVRLPDGTLVAGARAFTEMWARVPGFGLLARLSRPAPVGALLEKLYRGFLRVRPWLQRRARRRESTVGAAIEPWLRRELRSDHAGETGAVALYDGVLAVSSDPGLRRFAERHRATEARHLSQLETIIPNGTTSLLLPLWRLAGFLTGALPALFGPRAVYLTVEAVESFVDDHYTAQIELLTFRPRHRRILEVLSACRDDERAHRDEAQGERRHAPGPAGRLWSHIVRLGSSAGVAVARRL